MNVQEMIANKDVEALIKALDAEDELVACCAAEGLGAIRDKRSAVGLFKALTSGREWLSQEAGKALGQLGGQELVDDIINLCRDDNRYVRRGAATALMGIGASSASTVMVSLLRDPDREVRKLARRGLASLGTIGRETAEKQLGPDEAELILNPDEYRAKRQAQSDSGRRELEAQMSDPAKITHILSLLKPLMPSDPWLHENIPTGELERDELGYYSSEFAERLTVGKHANIREAVDLIRKFWKYPRAGRVKQRTVTVQKHKLIIVIKGTLIQGTFSEYYQARAQLTVSRISDDEFLVLSEKEEKKE